LAFAQTDASKYAQAHAGFQLRLDAVGSDKETGGTDVKSQGYTVKTARMSVSGDLSDSLSYVVRLDVKDALYTDDSAGPDTSIAALERAYIDQRLLPGLVLRLGRFPMMTLSIESDYSSMDRYYDSYILGVVAYKVAPITTGADLSYTVAGQTLTLQSTNGVQEVSGPGRGAQKGGDLSWAVGYRGRLLGGIVRPIISYDRFTRIRNGSGVDRDGKAIYTAWAVGSLFTYAHADLELEYDTFAKPAFTSHTFDAAGQATVVDNKDVKINSVIGQIAYNAMESGLRPFFKMSRDVEKTDGDESFKANRNALGVEWRPGPKNVRYHAVIVDKYDADGHQGPVVHINERQYIVGMAAKI